MVSNPKSMTSTLRCYFYCQVTKEHCYHLVAICARVPRVLSKNILVEQERVSTQVIRPRIQCSVFVLKVCDCHLLALCERNLHKFTVSHPFEPKRFLDAGVIRENVKQNTPVFFPFACRFGSVTYVMPI